MNKHVKAYWRGVFASIAPFVAIAIAVGIAKEVKADELWVTSGMWSRHNNEGYYQYNQHNVGIGLAYRTTPDRQYIVGEYFNSIKNHSNYFGIIEQPWNLGPFKVGYLAGFVSGYSKSITYEPMVAPVVSYEYKWVGINLIWVPSIVTAAQVKVKLLEW